MNIPPIEFEQFPKIARLSREIIVTEKIDGTNSTVYIPEDSSDIFAGSRNRWLTLENDNYGFAKWVEEHKNELMLLGPGLHRGEWWGQGLQRKYNLSEKRFSLFNVTRWCLHDQEPKVYPTEDPRIVKTQERLPKCCHLVPELYRGVFTTEAVEACLELLRTQGSVASPGFMRAEGVVVFHTAAGVGFKKTLEKDDEPKGRSRGNP